MNRRFLFIVFTIVTLLAISFPFIVFPDKELIEQLMLSFTALSGTATLLTLIIALLLYKKLTIDSFILERQTDKVLELVDYLKGKTVSIKIELLTYYIRFNFDGNDTLSDPLYKNVLHRKILINEELIDGFFRQVLKLTKSYWMPKEIKKSAKFFELIGYHTVKEPQKADYARMEIEKKVVNDNDIKWCQFISRSVFIDEDKDFVSDFERDSATVNDFLSNKDILVKSLENWIKNNSSLDIDLKMEESDKI